MDNLSVVTNNQKNFFVEEEKIPSPKKRISSLEFFISKKVGRAIFDYDMIQDNDKILVAVSGGKDSLTLLKILSDRLKFIPITYRLLIAHIESDFHCQGCVHTKTLEEYFSKNNAEYIFKKIKVRDSKKKVTCFWCSWQRRKALFEIAKENRCNKIAFGHHKDDIAETMLLNLFFNGEISTMPPKLSMFGGEFHIIRPLAYVEEKYISDFAKTQNFPANICKCPNSTLSNRKLMKKIIADIEKINPKVRTNITRSLKRIKEGYLL